KLKTLTVELRKNDLFFYKVCFCFWETFCFRDMNLTSLQSQVKIPKPKETCYAEFCHRKGSYLQIVFSGVVLAASVSTVYTFFATVDGVKVLHYDSQHKVYDGIICTPEGIFTNDAERYCNNMAQEMASLAQNETLLYNNSEIETTPESETALYSSWNCYEIAKLHDHDKTLFDFNAMNNMWLWVFILTLLYCFFMILHDCNLLCRNGRANFTWNHIMRSGNYPKIVADPLSYLEEHTPNKCFKNHCALCCWLLILLPFLCTASIIIFLLWTCAASIWTCVASVWTCVASICNVSRMRCKKSRFICIYSSWMVAFLRILVSSVAAISLAFGYVLQQQLHTNGWDKASYGFNQSIACSCSCNFYMKLNDFRSFLILTVALIITNYTFFPDWITDGVRRNQHLYLLQYNIPLRVAVQQRDDNPALSIVEH
ncbi:hypothetical protein RFI_34127, partial [Reticulomyxa filosa]